MRIVFILIAAVVMTGCDEQESDGKPQSVAEELCQNHGGLFSIRDTAQDGTIAVTCNDRAVRSISNTYTITDEQDRD